MHYRRGLIGNPGGGERQGINSDRTKEEKLTSSPIPQLEWSGVEVEASGTKPCGQRGQSPGQPQGQQEQTIEDSADKPEDSPKDSEDNLEESSDKPEDSEDKHRVSIVNATDFLSIYLDQRVEQWYFDFTFLRNPTLSPFTLS